MNCSTRRQILGNQGGPMNEADHPLARIGPGSPVIVYLHSPREKLWGLLYELNAAGGFLRGIDLNAVDDWMQMIVRGERNIGFCPIFLSVGRGGRACLGGNILRPPSNGKTSPPGA